MTEFIDRTADTYLSDHSKNGHEYTAEEEETDLDDDNMRTKKTKSPTSSGSWSIDTSIEMIQTMHKPMFDEVPTYSIKCVSPSGRSISPTVNEPISLFNLSISPISSNEDLTRTDQSICSATMNSVNYGIYTKDGSSIYDDDDDERISLEELTAQINTPPPALSRSNKRLNLETIFEDVFLETPKKRRFNGFKRFNSWRIETFHEITNEERISSYVFEQQQNTSPNTNTPPDTTNVLCNAFDDKINLNT